MKKIRYPQVAFQAFSVVLLMRIIFILIIIFCQSSILESAQFDQKSYDIRPIKNRPTGWGELKWQDPPSKLGDIVKVAQNLLEGTEEYSKRCEKTTLGDAQIGRISYRFKDSMLAVLEFTCEDFKDNEKLLNFAVKNFGNAQVTSDDDLKYVWFDNDMDIYLEISVGKPAILRYSFSSLVGHDNYPYFKFKTILNIPREFNGLQWGDSYDKLDNHGILIGTSSDGDELRYADNRELKILDNLHIESTGYSFFKSKLFFVGILFAQSLSNEQLIKYSLERFGTPMSISLDGYKYQWYDRYHGITVQLKKNEDEKCRMFIDIPRE